MNKYRIVNYWPSDEWTIQERIKKDNHTTDWMEVHRCTAKGNEGYLEAKKWIKENEK